MCGIVGMVQSDTTQPVDRLLLAQMCDLLAHRGPDDRGLYLSDGVGLGHRRLSIIDLAGGHQPMSNEDGSVWVVFNGEIYNHLQLRSDLEKRGHRFHTRFSDTEVVLHLYEDYGPGSVQYLNGMFAFALWDQGQKQLLLVRDRIGQKPIYYCRTKEGLCFASEIAPLLKDPLVSREIDPVALDQYLSLLYVPAPRTLFAAVRKLPAAHYLLYRAGDIRLERYWSISFEGKWEGPEEQLEEQLLELLQDATRVRLMSEVPLGAFLSGGLDSSMVVALMGRAMERPVRTFSVGFESEAPWFDERPYARSVAKHVGTDHTELVVSPAMADVLPKLVWHYGQPFADSSAIPVYYIAKAAREHVTVALGGDGGDELFAGYPWYDSFLRLTPFQSLLDGFYTAARHLLLGNRHALFSGPGSAVLDGWRKAIDPAYRMASQQVYFSPTHKRRLYTPELARSLNNGDWLAPYREALDQVPVRERLDQAVSMDLHHYLPDDILTKTDIATMASGLELRAPFLDHRVVEFACRLPTGLRWRPGERKVLLRRVARRLLPDKVIDRPKWGFGAPVNSWLRHDLRSIAEDFLLGGSLARRGWFVPLEIQSMWKEHISENRQYGHLLWQLVNLELWAQTFLQ